jgi:hypothetical protein
MIFRILIFAAFLFFISCSEKKQFPDFVSQTVEPKNISLNTQLPIFSIAKSNNSKIEDLDKLIVIQNQMIEKDLKFDLEEFKWTWNQIHKSNDITNANSEELKSWFDVSGFLLKITGDPVFAEEMERIALNGIGETFAEHNKIIAPYVFTKNTDNLFVNLFTPATIDYEHTTKGKVKVEMETNYPKSGKVDLKFSMTKRRYIEVNIRIPIWAVGATVTVKKVKYHALPGTYCKIAKKWKEGDLVEINFPLEDQPEYLK